MGYQAQYGRGRRAFTPPVRIGGTQQYDEHGNKITGFFPDGRTIIGQDQQGRPVQGGRNVGATPPAHPERNIGAIQEPDVFNKTPPANSQPAQQDRSYIVPQGISQQTQVHLQGPTKTGATLDTVQPPIVPMTMAEKMYQFNNPDRTAERADVGIYGGNGAGQQTMVPDGDPGTVIGVSKGPEPQYLSPAGGTFQRTGNAFTSQYGKGSVSDRPTPGVAHYVGDQTPPSEQPPFSATSSGGGSTNAGGAGSASGAGDAAASAGTGISVSDAASPLAAAGIPPPDFTKSQPGTTSAPAQKPEEEDEDENDFMKGGPQGAPAGRGGTLVA